MKIQKSITKENLVSITGVPESSLPSLQLAVAAFIGNSTDQAIHLLQKFRETRDYNLFETALHQLEQVSGLDHFHHTISEHNVATILPTTQAG